MSLVIACMNVCIHTYTHIHIYIHTFIKPYTQQTHACTSSRTYIHTYTYSHTHAHIHKFLHVYAFVCRNARINVCIFNTPCRQRHTGMNWRKFCRTRERGYVCGCAWNVYKLEHMHVHISCSWKCMAYAHTCMHVCVCVCVCACECMYIYIRKYAYMHTHVHGSWSEVGTLNTITLNRIAHEYFFVRRSCMDRHHYGKLTRMHSCAIPDRWKYAHK